MSRLPASRLEVRLLKRLPGFTLDVEWTAGEGVATLTVVSFAVVVLSERLAARTPRPA